MLSSISIGWLIPLVLLALLYFVRSFRRLTLYVVGSALGHAWLLYRHWTANTEQRQQKRLYLEQNPKWREHKEAMASGKVPPSPLTTSTKLPSASPNGSPSSSSATATTVGRKPSFSVAKNVSTAGNSTRKL